MQGGRPAPLSYSWASAGVSPLPLLLPLSCPLSSCPSRPLRLPNPLLWDPAANGPVLHIYQHLLPLCLMCWHALLHMDICILTRFQTHTYTLCMHACVRRNTHTHQYTGTYQQPFTAMHSFTHTSHCTCKPTITDKLMENMCLVNKVEGESTMTKPLKQRVQLYCQRGSMMEYKQKDNHWRALNTHNPPCS